jgi:hypothetical protein
MRQPIIRAAMDEELPFPPPSPDIQVVGIDPDPRLGTVSDSVFVSCGTTFGQLAGTARYGRSPDSSSVRGTCITA